jgi:hypothetical protein
MSRLTAILTTTTEATRVLVRVGDDEVLKASLPRWSTAPHARALPTLLEALALWHQQPVHAVLAATDEAWWFRNGLVDALGLGCDGVHFTVELRRRARGRRQRIVGLGNFDDLRQLVLGGDR